MILEWTIDLNHRKEPLLALDGKYLVISDQNNDVAALVPKDREDVARMIATAPELLEALKRVAAGEDLTGPDDLLGAINNAIAKAKGT